MKALLVIALVMVALVTAVEETVGVERHHRLHRHHHHRHHHHRHHHHRHHHHRREQSLSEESFAEVEAPPVDLVSSNPDIQKLAQIRNVRLEAALALAADQAPAVSLSYLDVLRRIVAFRLADPGIVETEDKKKAPDANAPTTHWKDAIAEFFQLPGAPTDPAFKYKPQEKCEEKSFSEFNTDRSGVAIDAAESKSLWDKCTTFAPGVPPKPSRRFRNLPDPDREIARKIMRDHSVMVVMSMLTRREPTNIRELAHFISRATECGEAAYEAGRESAIGRESAKNNNEQDSWFQKGCMRWIIWQAAKNSKSPYAKALVGLGFSLSHLEAQRKNVKPVQFTGSTKKKGWLTPLAASLCTDARPNGFQTYDAKTQAHRKVGDKLAFRFKVPGKPAPTKLTVDLLSDLGLSPLSDRESNWRALTSMSDDNKKSTFDDKTPIGWGVGGNVWMINGDDHPLASTHAKKFLAARAQQLLSTAAGPSGTTDEMLQMFDYAGLTQPAAQGVSVSKNRRFHLYNGILGAFANMGLYYHHSYMEVLQGAGAGFDGKNLVGRDFSYNPSNPYEWVLNPESFPETPETLSVIRWEDKTKKPIITIEPYKLQKVYRVDTEGTSKRIKPIHLDKVWRAFWRLSTPDSPLAAALLKSDFPDTYHVNGVDASDVEKAKGPHAWSLGEEQKINVQFTQLKDVCTNLEKQKFYVGYGQTLCDAFPFIDWAKTGVKPADGKPLEPYKDLKVAQRGKENTTADEFIASSLVQGLALLMQNPSNTFVVSFKQPVRLNALRVNFMFSQPKNPMNNVMKALVRPNCEITITFADGKKKTIPATADLKKKIVRLGTAEIPDVAVTSIEFLIPVDAKQPEVREFFTIAGVGFDGRIMTDVPRPEGTYIVRRGTEADPAADAADKKYTELVKKILTEKILTGTKALEAVRKV